MLKSATVVLDTIRGCLVVEQRTEAVSNFKRLQYSFPENSVAVFTCYFWLITCNKNGVHNPTKTRTVYRTVRTYSTSTRMYVVRYGQQNPERLFSQSILILSFERTNFVNAVAME